MIGFWDQEKLFCTRIVKMHGLSGKQKNPYSAVAWAKHCSISEDGGWARVNEFIPRLTATQKGTTCLISFKKPLKIY